MYGKTAVLTYAKGIAKYIAYKATGSYDSDDSSDSEQESLGSRIVNRLGEVKEKMDGFSADVGEQLVEAKTRFLSFFQK